ncbi:MAG: tyrosine-type recombinase/integrase [Steroidobacteraceae bacterium]
MLTIAAEKESCRVEFPAALELDLKAWKLACPNGEHNLVFPNQEGKPHSPANLLHRGLYPALRKAGLRKVRFHDLRHSFASLALASGENLQVVSDALGHADSSITLKVYRHLMPGEGRGLSDRLAEKVFTAGVAPPNGGNVVAK